MRGWWACVKGAFLFVLYLACGVGLVGLGALSISTGRYVWFSVVVFVGGPLLFGTLAHVISRKVG